MAGGVTAGREALARPVRIAPDWTGGRLVREEVLAADGDEAFADWAAARYPHGDFSLHGAREDYRRHLTEAEIRRDGVALARQDMRVIISLLAAQGIRASASGEVVVRNCGRELTALAARLKILGDGPGGFRVTGGSA